MHILQVEETEFENSAGPLKSTDIQEQSFTESMLMSYSPGISNQVENVA